MAKSNHLKKLQFSLPSSWYFDSNFYDKELSELWMKNWIYLCHSSNLKNNLDFRTFSIGKQNIILIRNSHGKLLAFYNTCRHRGSLIVTETFGRLKSKLFTCPYHQWSYSSDDGKLAKVASFSEIPEGFCKENFSLYKIALKEWRGCIFINLSEKPIWDDASVFQRSPEGLKQHPIENMTCGKIWEKTLNCNWKSFWENFNECLHCPNVHPELTDLVPMFNRRIINPRDLPNWETKSEHSDPKYSGGLKKGAETWSDDGSAQGRIIGTLSQDEILKGHVYASAWPSVFIGGYADHVRIVKINPIEPEKIKISAEWLFENETLKDKNYNKDNVISFACRVMEQDGKACELNQIGIHSKPHKQGVLMPEEYVIKNFHDWLKKQLKIKNYNNYKVNI